MWASFQISHTGYINLHWQRLTSDLFLTILMRPTCKFAVSDLGFRHLNQQGSTFVLSHSFDAQTIWHIPPSIHYSPRVWRAKIAFMWYLRQKDSTYLQVNWHMTCIITWTDKDYDNDHDIQRGPSETKIDYDNDHDIQRAPSKSNPRDLWPETWHLRHWLHLWQLRTTILTFTLWPLN